MPLLNGIEAVRQIRKFDPQVKVVFLTMHPDVTYAIRAFEAGASGYVLKHSASSELLPAIRRRAIKDGRGLCDAEYDRRGTGAGVQEENMPASARGHVRPGPSRKCYRFFAKGNWAKEVANLLNLSPRTVEFHKYNLMSNFKLKSVSALIQYAIKHGFTAIEDSKDSISSTSK